MTKKSWLIIAVICLLLVGCSQAAKAGIGESISHSNINEELNDLIEEDKVENQIEKDSLKSTEDKEESKDSKVNSNSNSSSDSQGKENNKKNQDENINTSQKDKSKDKDDSEKTKTVKTEEEKEEDKKEETVEVKVLSSSLSQSAVDLINQKRSEAGLNKLSYSSYLGNIALERAKQIVDDFSHNRFYSDYQSKDYKLGECLAYGYGSAKNAVNGWMASNAHRNVLMDSENVSIGVAYCGEYWVAVVSY